MLMRYLNLYKFAIFKKRVLISQIIFDLSNENIVRKI